MILCSTSHQQGEWRVALTDGEGETLIVDINAQLLGYNVQDLHHRRLFSDLCNISDQVKAMLYPQIFEQAYARRINAHSQRSSIRKAIHPMHPAPSPVCTRDARRLWIWTLCHKSLSYDVVMTCQIGNLLKSSILSTHKAADVPQDSTPSSPSAAIQCLTSLDAKLTYWLP